ncbi:MAG: LamG domain-containing protein [Candidatus Saccharimonadales bacterium]
MAQHSGNRHNKKLLLLLGLPLLMLLIGGTTYAAINLTTSSASNNQPTPPGVNIDSAEKGLVGYWPLNGNAKDATPYADNGTFLNGAAYTADREGQANSAARINGNNSYVSIPDKPNLEYTGGNFSVSAWVKPNANVSDNAFIISKPWNSNGSYNYCIVYYPNGSIALRLDARSNPYLLNATTTIPANQWSLVSFTITSSGAVTIYINGVASGSGQDTITNWNPISKKQRPLAIGTLYPYGSGWSGNPNFTFNGSISDVRVYNRAISAAEIKNLYNDYNSQIQIGGSGQPGSVSLGKGLVAYLSLQRQR